MAQVKLLKVPDATGISTEHDPDADEIQFNSVQIGSGALTPSAGQISTEGGIELNGSKITGALPPTGPDDGATKGYVDDAVPSPTEEEFIILNGSKLAPLTVTTRNGEDQITLITYSDWNGYSSHTLTFTYNGNGQADVITRVFTYDSEVWTYAIQLGYDVNDNFDSKAITTFTRV